MAKNNFLYLNKNNQSQNKIILPLMAADGIIIFNSGSQGNSTLQNEINKLNKEKKNYKSIKDQIEQHNNRNINENTHYNIYSKYINEIKKHNEDINSHQNLRNRITELKKEIDNIYYDYNYLQNQPDTYTTTFYNNKDYNNIFEILQSNNEIIATKYARTPTLSSYEEIIEIKLSEQQSKQIKILKTYLNEKNQWEQIKEEAIINNQLPSLVNKITLDFSSDVNIPNKFIITVTPIFKVNKETGFESLDYNNEIINTSLPLGLYEIQGMFFQNNNLIKSTKEMIKTYNNINNIQLNISFPLVTINLKEPRQPQDTLKLVLIENSTKEEVEMNFSQLTSRQIKMYIPAYSKDGTDLIKNSNWSIKEAILSKYNTDTQAFDIISKNNINISQPINPKGENTVELSFV